MIFTVLFLIYLMLFFVNSFLGIFLFMMIFFIILFGNYLFGVSWIKGDLFGVLGIDYLSFFMILLLIWLISVILILFYDLFLSFFFLLLLFFMFIMFTSMDLLYLFIYFEASILPVMLLVLFFGEYKERYLASMYMFIYTMFSSLTSLFVIIMFSLSLGSCSLGYLMLVDFIDVNMYLKFLMVFMFLVKIPFFVFHIWLPKAHVEAPVYGSMFLASIMLKMGGYGILRLMDFLMFDLFMVDFFFCFCISGGLLISYVCLYQVDMKVLVAYSSVIHMGIMVMGFFSLVELGYLGGVISMLSHGICSSGMFYLVNEIYKVTGSRLLMFNKGIMSMVPILGWFWFFLLIDNLGIPPCFAILGEFMLLGGCLGYSFVIFFMFLMIIFFMSCFTMNMFSLLMGGGCMFSFFSVNLIVYYGIFIHLISLNFFIFFISSCMG